MHGHQIRRAGELTNAEVWGGITGGALYSELRKLGAEGLIRAVREEQVGRRPARTVHEITGEGRLELVVQRDAALDVVFGSADPVSVVLLFAAGGDAAELGERLAARRRRIAVQLESMTAERERLTARGDSAMIERAALGAAGHGIRTVLLRTGYVLTADSLASQVARFRRHAGGWIGTGRGWTPWIHIADEVAIIAFALDHAAVDGPVNLTAPEPVRGREFARALGAALGRRAWLPVPTPIAAMGLGVVTDILVRGKRVVPAAVTAAGYRFRFPVLDEALADLTAGG